MRFYLIRLQVTPSRDKEKVRKETGGREISPGVVLNPERSIEATDRADEKKRKLIHI